MEEKAQGSAPSLINSDTERPTKTDYTYTMVQRICMMMMMMRKRKRRMLSMGKANSYLLPVEADCRKRDDR